MTSTEDAVLLDIQHGIASIRFNRPRNLNAISPELAESFLQGCRQIHQDSRCRAVVISGEGRAFMAGGDLSRFYQDFERAADTAEAMIAPMNEALSILASLPMPVLASLHGPVAGAGMSIALACDLAVAAHDVQFSFGYTQVGTSPDLGISMMLPRIVGLRRAMNIALLEDRISADQAMELGLVNWVVPKEDLAQATDAILARLASGPTIAYGKTKLLMGAAFNRQFESQLTEELSAFRACASTDDFIAGVTAFIEKRSSARFSGT
ncbi:enoyl-CoA hydratase/isomerase family protein [Cupriavidus consociatus]|uniref:enoyl-CoA hydratase/isomerase family protein n=1 Tax=Cupriavidus consociatus TaxID=2821357 RepID=UPI001AE2D5E9|nr:MULTISPECIES: enoyl-CoA hydratase-related protein [unclassified Cupriavidus]MBP0621151.1 enoyl-CoA hydratase/isomerase family protein [Cupriavidus sp. LEh25]MDK2657821.1 enoyl-CoA hydratase-related protein [Cupriavidus sp. LEh21]